MYDDDLPSINSDDEDDEDSWDSNIEDSDISGDENDDLSLEGDGYSVQSENSDEEMPYETKPRKPQREPEATELQRLPIKLADGKIQRTGIKAINPNSKPEVPSDSDEDESDSEEEQEEPPQHTTEDVSTGARFGRPAVVDVLKTNSRKAKVEKAKEQIAGICQEILADPENSVCDEKSSNLVCCVDFKPSCSLGFYDVYIPFLLRKLSRRPTPTQSPTTLSSANSRFYLS